MSVMKKLFYLLFLLGCTTQDGLLIESEQANIKVVSDQDATIFIDGKSSGTIQNGSVVFTDIPIGKRVITMFAEEHKLEIDTISLNSRDTIELNPIFEESLSGNLFIKSDIGASISIANLNIGTVDSLGQFSLNGFPVGSYEVIIQNESKSLDTTITISDGETFNLNAQLTLQQEVLIEYISNVSCDYCPEYAAVLYNILDSLDWKNISKISYNANWPATDDPLYLYDPQPQLDRAMLYGAEVNYALPIFVVNGEVLQFEASKERLKELLENAIGSGWEEEPTIQFDLTDSTINITSLLDTTYVGTLRVNLVQDDVTFETAPGSNGENEFLNVYRKLILNKNVTIEPGKTHSEIFTLDIGDLPRSNLRLTVFLQDADNQIIQTTDRQL